MNRAFTTLDVKAMDDDKREITGIASTPTADRMQDIVEPRGAKFKLPIPLLWQHDSSSPIGHVTSATVTDAGIEITAKFARVEEMGKLKDRLDEAWQAVKYGLVRGLSIGFSALESARIEGSYGRRFTSWEWLELSAVTVPANAEASISTIKQIATETMAASGKDGSDDDDLDQKAKPGASGSQTQKTGSVKLIHPSEKGNQMDIKKQIEALEATRQAKAARQTEIMEKAAEEGRSTDDSESEEFDTLSVEIERADSDLNRLRKLQANDVASAKPVIKEAGTNADVSNAVRGGANVGQGGTVLQVKSNLAPGVGFARYAMCVTAAKGNLMHAQQIAQARYKDMPELHRVIKAAVDAGTTSESTWAAPLVEYQFLASEFIEFLRPQTIIGRIPGLRRVPFNVKMPRQTSGGSAYWVGEGKAKPLTKPDFDVVTLQWAKIANIAVLTDELVRFSNPAAEMLVRDTLAEAIVQKSDLDFIDPSKAASAGVSPASLTNGLTPVTASGTTGDDLRADFRAITALFAAANISMAGGVIVMSETQAQAIGMIQNALGQMEFPGLTAEGGRLMGYTVITSQNVPANAGSGAEGDRIIFLKPAEVLLADDGQVDIAVSSEASLEMSDGPANDATDGTGASLVSMFQTNSVAIRAERYINWTKRRAQAVQYIDSAAYV